MEDSMKILGGIRFSVWSPVEVRKFSVAEVTAPETYDEDGMPVQGGLMDNRLGTLEPGQKCGTCGNTSAKCPGHFGHIELAEPVLHIAFVDDIHKLLLITCRSCNRIKLSKEELDKYKLIRETKAAMPGLIDQANAAVAKLPGVVKDMVGGGALFPTIKPVSK